MPVEEHVTGKLQVAWYHFCCFPSRLPVKVEADHDLVLASVIEVE